MTQRTAAGAGTAGQDTGQDVGTSGAPPPPARLELAAVGLALVLAVGTALQTVVSGAVLPAALVAAAAGGLLLTVLAAVRFALFVPVVLGLRTVVDVAHPVASTGGTQSSGLPATFMAVLFMVTALTWLAAQRRDGRGIVWSPVSTWALALLLAGAVSVLGSARPLTSAIEVTRVLASLLMFVVVEQLARDTAGKARLLLAVYLSALAPLVLVVQQFATGEGLVVIDGLGRVRGTFVHPNALGFYLALLIVTGVALTRHLQGRARVALVLVVLAASAGLVASYSRGAWVALVAGLVVVGLLQSKRLLAGLVVAVALVLVLVPSAQARLTDLEAGRTARGTAGNSFVWRVDYWIESLSLASANPLSGIGLKMTQFTTEEAKAPHNDFLRVYVEAGVLGLTAYLGLLVALARRARAAVRGTAGPGLERGLAVGSAGCLATFLVFSVGGNVVSQVVVLWYFLTLAALAGPAAGTSSAQGGKDGGDVRTETRGDS